MTIDVLYIVGTGSKFGNEELKYSLRSLETYVEDYGQVFITGVCPPFIDKTKVIHTHEQDLDCPMMSHWWKVRQTIEKSDISNNFVLMYDDIFFVKPTKLTNYPFYHKELLTDKIGDGIYRRSLTNAANFLKKEGRSVCDCELHIPCVYNKIMFKQMDSFFVPLMKDSIGMAVRSVYANYFGMVGPLRGDIKLRTSVDTVEGMIGNADCFSVSDWVYQCDTQRWLKEHFPNKSKFESEE